MKRKTHEDEMENDGFTLVVKQNKKKFRKEKKDFTPTGFNYKKMFETKEKNKKNLKELFKNKSQELKHSTIFQQITTSLNDENLNEIVCYGIGDFTNELPPQEQFSFLILLQQHFKISKVSIFDPVLIPNLQEIQEVLDFYKINFINENEECKRKANGKTLFYMPHCTLTMYNNVITTNFDQFENIIIIGNPLTKYSSTENIFEKFSKEEKISVDKKNYYFNDTCILRFEK
eukprot:gene11796-5130_t